MRTKFIKVSTADRLPETAGYYYAFRDDIGQNIVRYISEGKWFLPENTIHRVSHWLEEKPDYEEEMKDMLERIVKTFETDYVVDGEIVDNPYEWLQDVYKETKSILTKLKTES